MRVARQSEKVLLGVHHSKLARSVPCRAAMATLASSSSAQAATAPAAKDGRADCCTYLRQGDAR